MGWAGQAGAWCQELALPQVSSPPHPSHPRLILHNLGGTESLPEGGRELAHLSLI